MTGNYLLSQYKEYQFSNFNFVSGLNQPVYAELEDIDHGKFITSEGEFDEIWLNGLRYNLINSYINFYIGNL